MQHWQKLLLIDLLLVALATVFALILRDNFEVSADRLWTLLPYLVVTLVVASVMIPALGLNRSVWRLTAMTDYLTVFTATVVMVIGAVAISFGINRLDGIARALPVLQGFFILFALVGVRVLTRLWHAGRRRPAQLVGAMPSAGGETVLVVGLNRLSELYLRSVAELAPDHVKIAGLLGGADRHTGWSVQQHPILGGPEAVAKVLRDLEVHGILVDRIVISGPFEALSEDAQTALLEVERATAIRLDFIAERLGLVRSAATPAAQDSDLFSIRDADLDNLRRRPYWRAKRIVDVVAALLLLSICVPVMLLLAALVAFDLGRPVVFWQQRPGLGGQPFKLFKFRTMTDAHDAHGRLIEHAQRLTALGHFLRRSRLDELPQLLNVLLGEMSFVGPRPLLAVEQPAGIAARLLVRPGLTGWAQVEGGRSISAADKAALDIWYVHNASFALDFKILWRTLQMVLFGERVSTAAIQRAWQELGQAGICSPGKFAAQQHSCSVTEGQRAA